MNETCMGLDCMLALKILDFLAYSVSFMYCGFFISLFLFLPASPYGGAQADCVKRKGAAAAKKEEEE